MASGLSVATFSQLILTHVSLTSWAAFCPPAALMMACGPPLFPLVRTVSLAESNSKTTGVFAAFGALLRASSRSSRSLTAFFPVGSLPVSLARLLRSVRTASHGCMTPRAFSLPFCRQDSLSR